MYDVRALNELVAKESAFVDRLTTEVGQVIVGQQYMIERILVGLLTGGQFVNLSGRRTIVAGVGLLLLADGLRAQGAVIRVLDVNESAAVTTCQRISSAGGRTAHRDRHRGAGPLQG